MTSRVFANKKLKVRVRSSHMSDGSSSSSWPCQRWIAIGRTMWTLWQNKIKRVETLVHHVWVALHAETQHRRSVTV